MMSVTDAAAFTDPAIASILKRLDDVELGLLAQGLVGPERPGEEPGPRAPTLPSDRYPAHQFPTQEALTPVRYLTGTRFAGNRCMMLKELTLRPTE